MYAIHPDISFLLVETRIDELREAARARDARRNAMAGSTPGQGQARRWWPSLLQRTAMRSAAS